MREVSVENKLQAVISGARSILEKRSFAQASALGRGGVAKVAKATGISRRAIHAGLTELAAPKIPIESTDKRIRKAGAGRKSVIETGPGVMSVTGHQ